MTDPVTTGTGVGVGAALGIGLSRTVEARLDPKGRFHAMTRDASRTRARIAAACAAAVGLMLAAGCDSKEIEPSPEINASPGLKQAPREEAR